MQNKGKIQNEGYGGRMKDEIGAFDIFVCSLFVNNPFRSFFFNHSKNVVCSLKSFVHLIKSFI